MNLFPSMMGANTGAAAGPAGDWSLWDSTEDAAADTVVENVTMTGYLISAAGRGDDQNVVVVYEGVANNITLCMVDCGTSGTTPTPGTPVDKSSPLVGSMFQSSLLLIDTDKWLLVYMDDNDLNLYGVVVTYGGGTFTLGTRLTIDSSGTIDVGYVETCMWDSFGGTYMAVHYTLGEDGDAGSSLALLSVSTTTLTLEETLVIDATPAGALFGVGAANYSSTEVVLARLDTGDGVHLSFASRTTNSIDTPIDKDQKVVTISGTVSSASLGLAVTSTGGIAVAYAHELDGSPNDCYVDLGAYAWSGSAFTTTDAAVYTATIAAPDQFKGIDIINPVDDYVVFTNDDNSNPSDGYNVGVSEVTSSAATHVDYLNESWAYDSFALPQMAKIDDYRVLVSRIEASGQPSAVDIVCAIIRANAP